MSFTPLRKRGVGGIFRCYPTIGNYIADFYAPAAKLIVDRQALLQTESVLEAIFQAVKNPS
jgi:hypothetical protein